MAEQLGPEDIIEIIPGRAEPSHSETVSMLASIWNSLMHAVTSLPEGELRNGLLDVCHSMLKLRGPAIDVCWPYEELLNEITYQSRHGTLSASLEYAKADAVRLENELQKAMDGMRLKSIFLRAAVFVGIRLNLVPDKIAGIQEKLKCRFGEISRLMLELDLLEDARLDPRTVARISKGFDLPGFDREKYADIAGRSLPRPPKIPLSGQAPSPPHSNIDDLIRRMAPDPQPQDATPQPNVTVETIIADDPRSDDGGTFKIYFASKISTAAPPGGNGMTFESYASAIQGQDDIGRMRVPPEAVPPLADSEFDVISEMLINALTDSSAPPDNSFMPGQVLDESDKLQSDISAVRASIQNQMPKNDGISISAGSETCEGSGSRQDIISLSRRIKSSRPPRTPSSRPPKMARSG